MKINVNSALSKKWQKSLNPFKKKLSNTLIQAREDATGKDLFLYFYIVTGMSHPLWLPQIFALGFQTSFNNKTLIIYAYYTEHIINMNNMEILKGRLIILTQNIYELLSLFIIQNLFIIIFGYIIHIYTEHVINISNMEIY